MTAVSNTPATDRQIYYWTDDTGKQRRSDPMVLSRRFHEGLRNAGADLNRIRADIMVGAVAFQLDMGSEKERLDNVYDGLKSHGVIASAAYHAFQVKPLDEEGGWTEKEAYDALMAFRKWEDEVLGEQGGSPNTPPNSDSAGCPSNSPTESGTESTSAPSE